MIKYYVENLETGAIIATCGFFEDAVEVAMYQLYADIYISEIDRQNYMVCVARGSDGRKFPVFDTEQISNYIDSSGEVYLV